MSHKEIQISHDKILDPQSITKVVSDAFKEQGTNIHTNDCVDMVDDFSAGKRIYKVKKVKFFGPWSHRG